MLLQAVHAGMVEISQICQALEGWAGSIGKPACHWEPRGAHQASVLQPAIQAFIVEELRKVYAQDLSGCLICVTR